MGQATRRRRQREHPEGTAPFVPLQTVTLLLPKAAVDALARAHTQTNETRKSAHQSPVNFSEFAAGMLFHAIEQLETAMHRQELEDRKVLLPDEARELEGPRP